MDLALPPMYFVVAEWKITRNQTFNLAPYLCEVTNSHKNKIALVDPLWTAGSGPNYIHTYIQSTYIGRYVGTIHVADVGNLGTYIHVGDYR